MGIAKEIFGIERKDDNQYSSDPHICFKNAGFNEALDIIDQFEISEEAIEKIVYPYLAGIVGGLTFGSGLPWSEKRQELLEQSNKEIASAIKANANKIFVRRGE